MTQFRAVAADLPAVGPDLRQRTHVDERTFRSGAAPTAFAVAVCVAYALLTWHRDGRAELLAIDGVVALMALALIVAPLGPVLRGRACGAFVVAFSGTIIVLATESAALDGGVHSPLVALLFLPLAFASLVYPLRQVLAVALIDLLAFGGLALLTPGTGNPEALAFAGALATAAWMCAWQARDQDDRRRELALASVTDALTGALNRRGFDDRLAAALRSGAELTLVLADLDDFKAVNDAHGHAAGDELLRWVAARLAAAGATVGRMGGDEFAVLLPGRDETAAARIRTALADRAPASVGAAHFPADGATAEALLHVADAGLYASKGELSARPRDARAA